MRTKSFDGFEAKTKKGRVPIKARRVTIEPFGDFAVHHPPGDTVRFAVSEPRTGMQVRRARTRQDAVNRARVYLMTNFGTNAGRWQRFIDNQVRLFATAKNGNGSAVPS